ncbi:uncharacterized protein BT62DRAFT_184232 [Guyanagaster necrorhizus]|uniref:Ribonucleases P/MRP subunit Pop8-like domain-containing protein n=1 Tax=Guyanagaster necrorhizus TaxID=856835 RepID=A0A9P7VPX0_9AGAR|nr:uncharacterized protein BT62DRAFT_184232 [Guyanagaster necrorhizus MCA 3950]KAG7445228.1 hypothetical protein BT62DRAFT_184232 [Guyanagaster necrorhizus MCA 3950]
MNTEYHYMRFSVSPKISDALSVRQAIQGALVQAFGVAGGSIYLDILWVAEEGNEMVVRTTKGDSMMIVAAVTSASTPRISLQKESSFLPALSSTSATLDEEHL